MVTDWSARLRAIPSAVDEHGYEPPSPASPPESAFSAWLPGGGAGARKAWLSRCERARTPFRFLFAERYHAPSRMARELFHKGDIGLPIHLLVRVRVGASLVRGGSAGLADTRWLDEPLLNRLPLVVWMQGRVVDARCVTSARGESGAAVIMLRHETPGRLSILELSVSDALTHAGAPAVEDGFECTGSDGFVRVNGIWGGQSYLPRLELVRGAEQIIRRDLPICAEGMASEAANRAREDTRNRKVEYALAHAYLDACTKVAEPAARGV